MKNRIAEIYLKIRKKPVIASIDTLRTALRAADIDTMDTAIDLIAYYIRSNQPSSDARAALLEPIAGDEAFNQRISLVKVAAGI